MNILRQSTFLLCNKRLNLNSKNFCKCNIRVFFFGFLFFIIMAICTQPTHKPFFFLPVPGFDLTSSSNLVPWHLPFFFSFSFFIEPFLMYIYMLKFQCIFPWHLPFSFFSFLYVKVKLDFYVVDENTKDVNHQLHK